MRTWPPPRRPWVQAQSWRELLFAHWPVPVETLRALVPPRLQLDLHEGQAWLGIVPFHLVGLRPRGVPPAPALSRFLELNVRTYVTLDEKPGVFFFSLDAGSPLAVAGARTIHLPYFYAWLSARRLGDAIEYRSRRLVAGPPASFRGRYRPTGPSFEPTSGTLEHFLTERYCLYTADRRGRVARLEIDHPVWPLQPAEAEIEVNTMARAAGLTLPDVPPLLHYSRQQDMVAWPPHQVAGQAGC